MTAHQIAPVDLIEVWRGDLLESVHQGHIVVCDRAGEVVVAWGDPDKLVYPRSSAKMLQALPLLESGAAAARELTDRQVAFACASHRGAELHATAARDWLHSLGLDQTALACGPQDPDDLGMHRDLIRSGQSPCRVHNNCSGKHCGFLTLAQHLKAGANYTAPDHPVQKACRAAIEETCGETSPTFGIDGCSAPNYAVTLSGLARAMAVFASAGDRSDLRATAAARLVAAMQTYPEMVSGEGGADTALIRALDGQGVVKTGAEGVYVAILPERQLGVALKIADGTTRASEAAITAILVKLGVLNPDHPTAKTYMTPPIRNWDGLITGQIRPTAALQ